MDEQMNRAAREAMDRAIMLVDIIDRHLLSHPFITDHPELQAKVSQAHALLCEVGRDVADLIEPPKEPA